MTLQTQQNKVLYAGLAGQDTFAYNFRVDNKADMDVYFGINLVDPGEWTIDGLGNPLGGNVILNTPLVGDINVTLVRDVSLTQLVDYQPFDSFPAETHELALDRLTMQTQQLQEEVNRAYKAPIDSDPSEDFSFPTYDAGKLLGWSETEENKIDNAAYGLQDLIDAYERAEEAAVDSEASADLASLWAAQDEDVPVQGQLYSARHYAIKALKSTAGLNLRLIISGDDSCPKVGDEPGDCTAPDYRNPGQRFASIDHQTGDYYIISAPGSMDLKNLDDPGGSLVTQQVEVNDFIVFFKDDIFDGDELIVGAGWYRQPGLVGDTVPAALVSFDDTSTTTKGENVQVWNEAIDVRVNKSVNITNAFLYGMIGAVQAFADGKQDGEGGWFYCDGGTLIRAQYPDLFAKIGTNYGGGDFTTTFNLPDFRGKFLRAQDDGAGRDPNAATRTPAGTEPGGDNVGSNQTGALQTHQHGPAGGHQHAAVANHAHTASSPPHNHGVTGDLDDGAVPGVFDAGANARTIPGVTGSATVTVTVAPGGGHQHDAVADHQHAAAGSSTENRPINQYVRYYIFAGGPTL